MVVCQNCGQQSPDGFKFCPHCAAPLAPAEPAHEVRKTVTVLFSDVQGSTAMGEQIDPESLRRAMGRYFEAMRTVLERHGGTVEKFIGDAVMAVFGIPQLHEDDALRAVRAAAEMQEERERLNQELERDYGVRIESRTGVNTGEVVAGEGETLATGDAVNVAARLEQAAPTGGVLIGDQTYRLVRDAVQVEAVEPLELKGKTGRVSAFRLLGVTPGAAGHARRLDSPMVGRKNEQARLQQAFEQALKDHSCQLFTVLGTAGVGKSRLVVEFLEQVEQTATILRGRCLPYGEGITYWPLVEILQEAGHHEARARLVELLQGEEEAELIAGSIEAAIGVGDGTASSEEIFWSVRKLLERLARERPLVVVFDDLHWAEATFLDLVEHVADWSREAPILLLCIARPELLDTRQNWGGGKLNATSVLLEALSDPESEALIDNLLGEAELDSTVRRRIAEAAEGNPLFVEELLAMLVDDGLLVARNGTWAATADLSTLAIPPTIQVLLAARLDRLEAEERAVIGRAAVEGKVFHRGSVAELSPEAARAAVPSRLMTLMRKELIRPDRAAFAGEDAFRFRHLLIRDAAYEALTKEQRAELHERFAAWLEQKAADRLPEYAEILGYHFEQAYWYREQLGRVDENAKALGRRAAEGLAEAGRKALGRGDFHASVNLLERTRALLPSTDELRLEIVLDLADALWGLGELERAEAVLEDALETASSIGGQQSLLEAQLARTQLKTLTEPEGSTAELARVAEDSLPIFEKVGNDRGLARAWNALGWVSHCAGRYLDSSEAYEHAVVHARSAGHEALAIEAVVSSGTALMYGPLPVEDVIERCHQVLEGERPSTRVETSYLDILAYHEAMRDRVDVARDFLERGRATFRNLGLADGMPAVTSAEHAFLVEMLAGDVVVAEREIRRACELLEQMGEKGFLSTQAGRLAQALYEQGRYEEAERQTELSESAGASDDFATQVLWRQVRAKTLAVRGEYEPAKRLAREAVALGEPTQDLNMHGDALCDLAEVLKLAGDREEARRALEQALELYDQKGNIVSAARVKAALADLEPA
jgi:class 3 adenylate cyclase/tetratricopeptide (TPR) repeat protein